MPTNPSRSRISRRRRHLVEQGVLIPFRRGSVLLLRRTIPGSRTGERSQPCPGRRECEELGGEPATFLIRLRFEAGEMDGRSEKSEADYRSDDDALNGS
jgi:hypothetical protein